MLNPPSKAVVTRVVGTVGALVAITAFLIFTGVSPDSAFAQTPPPEPVMLQHEENNSGPISTFLAEDPEGAGIDWDVTGTDAKFFTITSEGVLSFKKVPDFESHMDKEHATGIDHSTGVLKNLMSDPVDAGDNGTYAITVRATEKRTLHYPGRVEWTETEVRVEVLDVDEDGKVVFQWREPEVGVAITATLTDPDMVLHDTDTAVTPTPTNPLWIWSTSTVSSPIANVDDHWTPTEQPIVSTTDGDSSTFTPMGAMFNTPATDDDVSIDDGRFLRVKVTYQDGEGTSKTAVMKTDYPVRAKPAQNGSPDFGGVKTARTVPENTPVDGNVGVPVVAQDPDNAQPPIERLTYKLAAFTDQTDGFLPADDRIDLNNPARPTDVDSFSVDWATGQIKVKKSLNWERPIGGPFDGKYVIIVQATDPGGETDNVLVTITATDVNERPKLDPPTPDPLTAAGAMELSVNELLIDEEGYPFYDPLGTTPRTTGIGTIGGATNMENRYSAMDEDETGTITWHHEGEDAGVFNFGAPTVAASPTLKFKNANRPDYEAPMDSNRDNVYHVTLIARDNLGLEAKRDVTVFVVNRKEAYDTADGTEPNPKLVTFSMVQPQIGVPLAAMVEDPDGGKVAGGGEVPLSTTLDYPGSRLPDGGVTILTWQWAKSKNMSGPWTDIPEATSPTYTPERGDKGYFLLATVTHTDSHSMKEDDPSTTTLDERVEDLVDRTVTAKTAEMGLYTEMGVTANAVDVRPGAPVTPVFEDAPYVREINENTKPGGFVGYPVVAMDPDSDPEDLRYELKAHITGSSDHRLFDITDYGQIMVKESPQLPLDYERQRTYTVKVTATDEDQNTGEATVAIRVMDLNEMPWMDARSRNLSPISRPENDTDQVADFDATDPEDAAIQWYVMGEDPVRDPTAADAQAFAINNAGVLTFKRSSGADFEGKNEYLIKVRATEVRTAAAATAGKRAKSDTTLVTVNIDNEDEDGEVTLDLLQPEVETPITASLSDPDVPGSGITWKWYRATVAAPTLTPDKLLNDASDIDTQWAEIENSVTETYTPAGTPDNLDTNDIEANTLDVGRFLLAEASYTDGHGPGKKAYGMSVEKTRLDIDASLNRSPEFDVPQGGAIWITVQETASGAIGDPVTVDDVTITVVGDARQYDIDEVLTYELEDATESNVDIAASDVRIFTGDSGTFSIDKATGQLSAKRLDHEAGSRDGDGVYVFAVRAKNSSNESGSDTAYVKVIVTVTDVNEAPEVKGPMELTVEEKDSSKAPTETDYYTAILPHRYTIEDLDEGDSVTWALAGPDANDFVLSDVAASGGDPAGLRINFKKSNPDLRPDYEAPTDANGDNLYELRLVATDNAGISDEQKILVIVTPHGTAGVEETDPPHVKELGKLTLMPAQPRIGEQVMAMLEDPDGHDTIRTWKWEKSKDRAFSDTPTTVIMGATMSTYTTTADDDGYFLRATVTYTDDSNPEDHPATTVPVAPATSADESDPDSVEDTNGNAKRTIRSPRMLMKATENAVLSEPASETTPTFPASPRRMVAENTPKGGYVGDPIMAMDPDAGDALEYKLDGDDSKYFDLFVHEAEAEAGELNVKKTPTGQIMVKRGTVLDYEAGPRTYNVKLTATDLTDRSASVDVVITVGDVNEPPADPGELFGGLRIVGSTNPGYDEDETGPVGTYSAAGASGTGAATWSLSGTDASDLSIDRNSGVLTFNAAPNFEAKAMYRVTVTARVGSETESADVTVNVTNVEEMGEVTLWASATEALTMAPQVGDTITGAVMDPDGGVTGESWQWARTTTPAMMDSWMDIAGETNAAYTVTEGDTGYYLRVMATYTDAVGTDTAMEYSMPTMMVGAEAGDPLFGYDTSGNGRIDKDELANAVFDYEIDQTLGKPALADLVFSYELGL